MIIEKDISEKVLMVGVNFRDNATGGMATVIQNYDEYIENLNYVATWKPSNIFVRLYIALIAYCKIFFILLCNHKIKIVHIHGAAYGSFYRKKIVIKLSKLFKKKIIYHMHGGEFKCFYESCKDKQGIIKTINSCDICLLLSKSWKIYFESIGIIPNKIYILNNSIHHPYHYNQCEITRDKNILNILYLGTLVKEKGIFDLLDVFVENKECFKKKIRLTIGGIQNEHIIEDIINKNGLKDFVTFKGWINKKDKELELAMADILILPSYFEALPMVILEAMSFECAIIATNVGGIPDIITNDVSGELIIPGDKVALKNSIEKLITNKEIIRQYQIEGKEIVKSFYPSKVFEELKSIYNSLLSQI